MFYCLTHASIATLVFQYPLFCTPNVNQEIRQHPLVTHLPKHLQDGMRILAEKRGSLRGYMLISWLLNAAHDVSWLLFRSNPYAISALWESWDSLSPYLTLAVFFALFSIIHYSMTRNQRETRGSEQMANSEQKKRGNGKVRYTHYFSFLRLTRLT